MEFVKKIPSSQNVLAYLTLQSAAWQKSAKVLQIPVQIVLLFMFNFSCCGVRVSRCLALAVRWCGKTRVNNVAFYQTEE